VKVAFVAARVPYPLDAGGKIRTYHLLEQLSRVHDVTLITATETEAEEAAVAELGSRLPALRYRVAAVPPRHAAHRRWARIVASPLDPLPYTWAGFRHRRFSANLSSALREETYDLLHCDHIQVAPAVVALATPPRLLNAHNVESVLLRRLADNEPRAWRRRAIAWQADKVRRAERALCRAFGAAVAVSEIDRERLRQLAPQLDVTVVPNGVDVKAFAPPNRPGEFNLMVFAGAMDWLPNVEGLRWFVSKVFPLIRRRVGGVRLLVVGRGPAPALVRELSVDGVSFTGTVSDVRPYLERASLVVVPLLSGGGTRLKILEAWAMARPVVSTPLGAEGLPAIDGHNIALGRTPGEFAMLASDLLVDPVKSAGLGAGGRRLAEEVFDWSRVVEPLLGAYERLVRRGHADAHLSQVST
jgi:glycosyltransferase involved in cell wall biosynthesis